MRAANADFTISVIWRIGAHLFGQRQHGVQGVVRGSQGVPTAWARPAPPGAGAAARHRAACAAASAWRRAPSVVLIGSPASMASRRACQPQSCAKACKQGFGLGGAKVLTNRRTRAALAGYLGQALRVAGKRLGQIELRHVVLVMGRQGRPGGRRCSSCAGPGLAQQILQLARIDGKARMPSASFSVAMASSFRQSGNAPRRSARGDVQLPRGLGIQGGSTGAVLASNWAQQLGRDGEQPSHPASATICPTLRKLAPITSVACQSACSTGKSRAPSARRVVGPGHGNLVPLAARLV